MKVSACQKTLRASPQTPTSLFKGLTETFKWELRFLKNIDFIRKNTSFSSKVFCQIFLKKV